MSAGNALHFLPWLRSGLAAVSEAEDARRKATVTLKVVDGVGTPLKLAGETSFERPHVVTLKGPGDVLGFDPSLVARTEPKKGANDFEPNYFPFIEFIDSDFPWRYSPDSDSGGKLPPWIVLLVLKNNEFQAVRSAQGRSARIRILSKDGVYPFPDLTNAWAWAHVQIAGPLPDDTTKLSGYLEENPGLHCSRLMCPRKLEPLTRYTAFVVPVYEAGRLAGLGLEPTTNPGLAWTSNSAPTEPPVLPVYFQWEFQTSEAGDFEKLIDIIKPQKGVPEGVGVRSINGSKPGFLKDADGTELEMVNDIIRLEGALVPPGYMQGESDGPKREPLTNSGFTRHLSPVLDSSLEPSAPLDRNAPDPLVSIPVYGCHFQPTSKMVPPEWQQANSWLHELNLDRRYRVPASMGTSVAQQNQEEYMDECWEQVGEIREANHALRLAAASKLLNDNIRQRHIDPLSDSRFALISRPFQHYYIHGDGKDERSFKYRFEHSGLPPAIMSSAFRSVASKKVGLQKEKLLGPWEIAKKNDSFWRKVLRYLLYLVKLLILGLTLLVRLADKYQPLLPTLRLMAQGTGQTAPRGLIIRVLAAVAILLMQVGVRLRGAIPFLEKLLFRLKVPVVNEIPRTSRTDTKLQKDLSALTGENISLSSVCPLKSEIIEVKPIDIAGSFRPLFDTRVDLMERLNTTISLGAAGGGELISFDPIWIAPHIDLSMYAHLSERSVDLMVPGLKEMQNNTVILMEENRKFIEAFMVGLNHEWGRELVWRGYPTDQRGTIFRYFWDLRAADNPPPDVADIHTWSRELGRNTPAETQALDNRLVLAIKADLIRRYPDIIVFSIRTKKEMDKEKWRGVFDVIDGSTDAPSDVDFEVFKPVLSANVYTDILFVGFEFSADKVLEARAKGEEYYFVLMQQPSLPRFGLDVGVDAPPVSAWNELSWGHVIPDEKSGWITTDLKDANAVPDKFQWMKSSAAMGMITFQQPVRIVRPSSDFMEEKP